MISAKMPAACERFSSFSVRGLPIPVHRSRLYIGWD
jgi:hypothetical protein